MTGMRKVGSREGLFLDAATGDNHQAPGIALSTSLGMESITVQQMTILVRRGRASLEFWLRVLDQDTAACTQCLGPEANRNVAWH
jgi:hypothetical protein